MDSEGEYGKVTRSRSKGKQPASTRKTPYSRPSKQKVQATPLPQATPAAQPSPATESRGIFGNVLSAAKTPLWAAANLINKVPLFSGYFTGNSSAHKNTPGDSEIAIVIGDDDDGEIQPAATVDINGELAPVDNNNNNGGPSKQQKGPNSGDIVPAVVATAVSKRQPTPNPLSPLSPPSDAEKYEAAAATGRGGGGGPLSSTAQAAKHKNKKRSNGDLVIINETMTLDASKSKDKGKEAVNVDVEAIIQEEEDGNDDVWPAVNLDLTTTPYDEFNQVMRQGPLSSGSVVPASPAAARRKFQPPLSQRHKEEVEEEGRKRLAAKLAGASTPFQHHHHLGNGTGTAIPSPPVPPTVAVSAEQDRAADDQVVAGGDAQQQAIQIQRRYIASRLGPYGSTHAAAAPSSGGLRTIYNTQQQQQGRLPTVGGTKFGMPRRTPPAATTGRTPVGSIGGTATTTCRIPGPPGSTIIASTPQTTTADMGGEGQRQGREEQAPVAAGGGGSLAWTPLRSGGGVRYGLTPSSRIPRVANGTMTAYESIGIFSGVKRKATEEPEAAAAPAFTPLGTTGIGIGTTPGSISILDAQRRIRQRSEPAPGSVDKRGWLAGRTPFIQKGGKTGPPRVGERPFGPSSLLGVRQQREEERGGSLVGKGTTEAARRILATLDALDQTVVSPQAIEATALASATAAAANGGGEVQKLSPPPTSSLGFAGLPTATEAEGDGDGKKRRKSSVAGNKSTPKVTFGDVTFVPSPPSGPDKDKGKEAATPPPGGGGFSFAPTPSAPSSAGVTPGFATKKTASITPVVATTPNPLFSFAASPASTTFLGKPAAEQQEEKKQEMDQATTTPDKVFSNEIFQAARTELPPLPPTAAATTATTKPFASLEKTKKEEVEEKKVGYTFGTQQSVLSKSVAAALESVQHEAALPFGQPPRTYTFGSSSGTTATPPPPPALMFGVPMVKPIFKPEEANKIAQEAAKSPLPALSDEEEEEEKEAKKSAKKPPVSSGGWDLSFLQQNKAGATIAAEATKKEIEKTAVPTPTTSAPKFSFGMPPDAKAKKEEEKKEAAPAAAPVVSGWGDAFLNVNKAAASEATTAVEKEIEKTQAPARGTVSAPSVFNFGAPATASAEKKTETAAPMFTFGGASTKAAFNFGAAPAAAAAAKSEVEKPTAPPAFTFGAGANSSAEAVTTTATTPVFKFGEASTTGGEAAAVTTTAAAAPPVFTFGSSSGASSSPATTEMPATTTAALPVFTFGGGAAPSAPTTTTPAAPAAFAFGPSATTIAAAPPPPPSSTSQPTFTFGASTAAITETKPPASTGFAFGGASTTPAFTFGASSAASTPAAGTVTTPFGGNGTAGGVAPNSSTIAEPSFNGAFGSTLNPAAPAFGGGGGGRGFGGGFGGASAAPPPAAASQPVFAFGSSNGAGASAPAPAAAASLFGFGAQQQQAPPPAFGGGAAPAQSQFTFGGAATSGFGGQSQQQQQQQPVFGFGAPQQQPASSPSAFGSNTFGSTGGFGAPPPTSTTFGQQPPAQPGSVFTSQPQQQPPSQMIPNNPFGGAPAPAGGAAGFFNMGSTGGGSQSDSRRKVRVKRPGSRK